MPSWIGLALDGKLSAAVREHRRLHPQFSFQTAVADVLRVRRKALEGPPQEE